MGDKSAGEGRPPPSPLTGGYLLIVLPQAHFPQHKDNVLHNLTKGLITWDKDDCHIDLEKELETITAQAPEGEEAKNGERLIQFASENLVTEVLIHPQLNTLVQCLRNLLSSFTRHRHIIHAGYTCAGNGAWLIQDGTYSFADFADMFQELEVQRVLRAYENTVTVDVHCCQEGDWNNLKGKDPFSKVSRVRLNPNDKLSGSKSIHGFVDYLKNYVVSASLEELLESSEVVGNIRFSHPTLYVFPGGQGDAALFGINGFNMLIDGGFARKACFWDFTRHLDRLDAVLMTRINNGNVLGLSSLLQRKKMEQVYPQIGHFFCNIQEKKHLLSPDGDKDKNPLLINLIDFGHEMIANLKHIQLKPQACFRESSMDPINLYHKVGHGKLDMYVLSPSKDSREVRDFMVKWNTVDSKIFCSYNRRGGEFNFPLSNRASICALLVWQPANPEDNITRILFPGSTPQHKIFEGLDRLKSLEFLKHAVCSAKKMSPSPSSVGLNIRNVSRTKTPAIIDKLAENEMKQGKGLEAVKPVVKAITNADKVQKSQPAKTLKPKQVDKPKDKIKTDVEMKPETVKNDIIKQTEAVQKVEKPKEKPKKLIQKSAEKKTIIEKKATEKKSETNKSTPTTPKKVSENKLTEAAPKPEPKSRSATRTRPSPSATPAKSAKEANNRKVLEQKSRDTSKTLKKDEPKKIEKPAPKKTSSPSKTTKSSSPVKVSRPPPKKQEVKKVTKPDKEVPTDSAVSTPSTTDVEKAKDIAEKETVVPIEVVESAEDKDDKRSTLSSKEDDEDILIIEKVEIGIAQDVEAVEELKVVQEEEEPNVEAVVAVSDTDAKPATKEDLLDVQQSTGGDTSKSKIDALKTESQETSAGIKDLPSEKITPSKEKDVKEKSNEMIEQRNQADESQPDEKFSTTVESGQTTTAPTLPEDERIPLDEVKEGVEEKHIKEDTKEKDTPPTPKPDQPTSLPQVPMIPSGILFDQRAQLLKDIVKTPDEVADLPVHEEADGGFYDSGVRKEITESKEDLLEIPSGKRPADKLEAVETDELKFIKDGFEKEDKSKDLKEDINITKDKPEEKVTEVKPEETTSKDEKPEEPKQKEQEEVKEDIEAKIKGDLDVKEKDLDTVQPEDDERSKLTPEVKQILYDDELDEEVAAASKLPKDILKYEATLLDDDTVELEEDKDKETEKESKEKETIEEKFILDSKEKETDEEKKIGQIETKAEINTANEALKTKQSEEENKEKIDSEEKTLDTKVEEVISKDETTPQEIKVIEDHKIKGKDVKEEAKIIDAVIKEAVVERVEVGKLDDQLISHNKKIDEVKPDKSEIKEEKSIFGFLSKTASDLKDKITEKFSDKDETKTDIKDSKIEKEVIEADISKEAQEWVSVTDKLKSELHVIERLKEEAKPIEETPKLDEVYASISQVQEIQEEIETVIEKEIEETIETSVEPELSKADITKEIDVPVCDEMSKDVQDELLRKASLLKEDDITIPDKEVYDIMQTKDGIISEIEATIKESLPGTAIEPPKIETCIEQKVSSKAASQKSSPSPKMSPTPRNDAKKSLTGENILTSDEIKSLTESSPVKASSPESKINGQTDTQAKESPKDSPVPLKKEDDSRFDISEDSPADIYKKDSLISLVDTKSETSREVSPIPIEGKITLDSTKFEDKETLKRELEIRSISPEADKIEMKIESKVEAFPLPPRDDKNKEPEKQDDEKEKPKEEPEKSAQVSSPTLVNGTHDDRSSHPATPQTASRASSITSEQPLLLPQQDGERPSSSGSDKLADSASATKIDKKEASPEKLSPEPLVESRIPVGKISPAPPKMEEIKEESIESKTTTPGQNSPALSMPDDREEIPQTPTKIGDDKKASGSSSPTKVESKTDDSPMLKQTEESISSSQDQTKENAEKASPTPVKEEEIKETKIKDVTSGTKVPSPIHDEINEIVKSSSPISESFKETEKRKSPSPDLKLESDIKTSKLEESVDSKIASPSKELKESKSPSPVPSKPEESKISPLPSNITETISPSTAQSLEKSKDSKSPSPAPSHIDEKDEKSIISPEPEQKDSKSPTPSHIDEKDQTTLATSPGPEHTKESKSPSPAPSHIDEKDQKPVVLPSTLETKELSSTADEQEEKPISSLPAKELKDSKSASPAPSHVEPKEQTLVSSTPEQIKVSKSPSPAPSHIDDKDQKLHSPEQKDSKSASPAPIDDIDIKSELAQSPEPIKGSKPQSPSHLDDKDEKVAIKDSKSPSPSPHVDGKDKSTAHSPVPEQAKDSKPPSRTSHVDEKDVKSVLAESPAPGKIADSKSPSPAPSHIDDNDDKSILAHSPVEQAKDSKPQSRAPSHVDEKDVKSIAQSPAPEKIDDSKSPSPAPSHFEDDVKSITAQSPLPEKTKDSKPSSRAQSHVDEKDVKAVKAPESIADSKSPSPAPSHVDEKDTKSIPQSPEPEKIQDSKPSSRAPSHVDEKDVKSVLAHSPAPDKITDSKSSSPAPSHFDEKDVKSQSPAPEKADLKSPSPAPSHVDEVTKSVLGKSPEPEKIIDSKPSSRAPSNVDEKDVKSILAHSPVPEKIADSKSSSPAPSHVDEMDEKSAITQSLVADSKSPSPAPSHVDEKDAKSVLAQSPEPEKIMDSKPSSRAPSHVDEKDVKSILAHSPVPEKISDSKSASPAPSHVDEKDEKTAITQSFVADSKSPSPAPSHVDEKDEKSAITQSLVADSKSPSPAPSHVDEKDEKSAITQSLVADSKSPSPAPSHVDEKDEKTAITQSLVADSKSPSPAPSHVDEKDEKSAIIQSLVADSKSPSPAPSHVDEKDEKSAITQSLVADSKSSSPAPSHVDGKDEKSAITQSSVADSKSPSPAPSHVDEEAIKSAHSQIDEKEQKSVAQSPVPEQTSIPASRTQSHVDEKDIQSVVAQSPVPEQTSKPPSRTSSHVDEKDIKSVVAQSPVPEQTSKPPSRTSSHVDEKDVKSVVAQSPVPEQTSKPPSRTSSHVDEKDVKSIIAPSPVPEQTSKSPTNVEEEEAKPKSTIPEENKGSEPPADQKDVKSVLDHSSAKIADSKSPSPAPHADEKDVKEVSDSESTQTKESKPSSPSHTEKEQKSGISQSITPEPVKDSKSPSPAPPHDEKEMKPKIAESEKLEAVKDSKSPSPAPSHIDEKEADSKDSKTPPPSHVDEMEVKLTQSVAVLKDSETAAISKVSEEQVNLVSASPNDKIEDVIQEKLTDKTLEESKETCAKLSSKEASKSPSPVPIKEDSNPVSPVPPKDETKDLKPASPTLIKHEEVSLSESKTVEIISEVQKKETDSKLITSTVESHDSKTVSPIAPKDDSVSHVPAKDDKINISASPKGVSPIPTDAKDLLDQNISPNLSASPKDIENGYVSEEYVTEGSKQSSTPSEVKISEKNIMSEIQESLKNQGIISDPSINEKDLSKDEVKVTDILDTAERIVSSLHSTSESFDISSVEKKGEEKMFEITEKIAEKQSEIEISTSVKESIKEAESAVKKIDEVIPKVEEKVKESTGFFSGLKASVVDSIGKVLKTDTKEVKTEVKEVVQEIKTSEPTAVKNENVADKKEELKDVKEITSSFLMTETQLYDSEHSHTESKPKIETKVVQQSAEIVEDILQKGKEYAESQSSVPSEMLVSSTISALKKEFPRSTTPSDAASEKEFDLGRSTPRSDTSSGQVSHAVTQGWGHESKNYDSDEDIPSSPMSVTSHIHTPPHFDYELSKDSMMTGSVYGALPDEDFPQPPKTDPMYTSMYISKFEDDLTLDKDSALRTSEPTSVSGTSEPKPSSSEKPDPIGKWDKPLGLPPPPALNSRQFNYWNPYKEWGQPLGLPSPAPPPREDTDIEVDTSAGSAKTTPKKVAKMNAENNKLTSNTTTGKEVNNKTKRSDSPVKRVQPNKERRSGVNSIYLDLSYVPHHGNSHYANVEFFKRVRARYYVFSGTEPSKEVFNALLEAKQTWEDKDLEVTIIPTYDTDILGYWIAENEETLAKYKIDLSPSASRCTINLQDHDTSCSAYRLEF